MAVDSPDRVVKEGFSELTPEWEDRGGHQWECRRQREG